MRSTSVLSLLADFESPNVTHLAPDGRWPIVWERARGCHVWTPEGRKYLDLTAAFGVAAAGHSNARVVRAGQKQLARLAHAMGDVHPHPLKAQLARELSRWTFERWKFGTGRTVFGNSGFEAIEAALKTARLATGKAGVLAFEGAYHGLGYGALNTTHRDYFRRPFLDQIGGFAMFVPFPAGQEEEGRQTSAAEVLEAIRQRIRRQPIGAVLMEPIQVRGGVRIPPSGFLHELRRICEHQGVLLILDEIYTGFGRTGRWFACEHEGVVPDLICLGKALTGGFPLSACVGRSDLMAQAWPRSAGEAMHTSTYLGNPVGCAMALAQLAELRRRRLAERAARLEPVLQNALEAAASGAHGLVATVRIRGLLAGLELRNDDGTPAGTAAFAVVQRLLSEGFVLLPEGASGEVIGITPPLIIPVKELIRATRALKKALDDCRRVDGVPGVQVDGPTTEARATRSRRAPTAADLQRATTGRPKDPPPHGLG
ncbi:MAG: aspartate aminotransferase family protein [Verrucomicrobiales bacterium]|nr:aspartate aminotransferase family protein [Verrucomicrobiales bacterium]